MTQYIAMDLDLPDKPQFVQIRDQTDYDDAKVAGLLFVFWRWVNAVCEPHPTRQGFGLLPNCNIKSAIRKVGGDEIFWKAVATAEWVEFSKEGIVVPGYAERFSPEAKKRWRDKSAKQDKRSTSFAVEEDRRPAVLKQSFKEEPSVFANLTTELLRNTEYMLNWVTMAASKPNPLVQDDDYHRQIILAATYRAFEGAKPVGLFASIVTQRQWTRLESQYVLKARRELDRMAGRQPTASHPDVDRGADESFSSVGSLTAGYLKMRAARN